MTITFESVDRPSLTRSAGVPGLLDGTIPVVPPVPVGGADHPLAVLEREGGPVMLCSADSERQSTAAQQMNDAMPRTGQQFSADAQRAIREYFESITDGSVLRFVPRLFGASDRPSFSQVRDHAGELLESYFNARFPDNMQYRPQSVIADQRIDDNTYLVSLLLRSPRVGSGGRIQGYGEPYRHGISFLVRNNGDGTVSVSPVRDSNGTPGTNAFQLRNGLRLERLGSEFTVSIR